MIRAAWIVLIFACSLSCKIATSQDVPEVNAMELQAHEIIHDTTVWYDSIRNRPVPVACFYKSDTNLTVKKQLVLFNHGYGRNNGLSYLKYSYLTDFLAEQGYFVVSIQHENENDPLLAMKGDIPTLRRPNWERGVANIEFVRSIVPAYYPYVDSQQVIMIGHSNGGDMSALYAASYPKHVLKLITLDNLRYPLGGEESIPVLTIRASDTKADPGVIPVENTTVVVLNVEGLLHGDMDDKCPDHLKSLVLDRIRQFLHQ